MAYELDKMRLFDVADAGATILSWLAERADIADGDLLTPRGLALDRGPCVEWVRLRKTDADLVAACLAIDEAHCRD